MSKIKPRLPYKRFMDNILQCYQESSDVEKREGNTWYQQANEWCQQKAKKYNVKIETVVGIVAALSPACGVEQNLIDANNILKSNNPSEVIVTSYGQNKAKAIKIKEGQNPLDVLGGRKVKAFYDNMLNPESSNLCCVDRHALCIALGRPLTESERNEWNQERKHEIVENSFITVATAIGIKPHQLQAATWISYRNSLKRKLQDAIPF
jgi:hypothetical protein